MYVNQFKWGLTGEDLQSSSQRETGAVNTSQVCARVRARVNILTSLLSDFVSSNSLLEPLKSRDINRSVEPRVGWFIYSPGSSLVSACACTT